VGGGGGLDDDAGAAAGDSQRELAAIVRWSSDAIIGKTLDGTITSWNTGAERLYGYTAAEAIGKPISMLVPDDAIDELPGIFARLRAGLDVPTYETRRIDKQGHVHDVSLTVSPVFDLDGNITGASAIARDIGHARREAARTARLLEVTAALAGANSVDAVVRAATELAVRATDADGAVFVVADHDRKTACLVGSWGYDREATDAWKEWSLDDALPVNDAMRSGRLLVFESTDEMLERYPALAPMRITGSVAVPLATDGPPLGALWLRFAGPRRFTTGDRDELRTLGGQCAIALERARLFEAERTARERLTFLSDAGEALAGSLDVDTLLSLTAELAVPRLADWCGVSVVQENGSVRRFGFHHADRETAVLGRQWWESTRFPAARTRGAPQVIRTGEPELTPSIQLDAVEAYVDPDEAAILRELGLASSMVVPLIARGRTVGALTLARGPSSRPYGAADLELARDLARRAALAADNARLFAERAHVARRLQESLLPRVLPSVPGISLAAQYLAAGEGTEVGGDFYDVFALGGSAWALVVGDVCGKGADAAGITALARYTLRALAPHGRLPSQVLGEVNDALVRQSTIVTDERFLTAAYGVLLQSGDGRARLMLALAGHAPPAVLRADGSVERVGTPGTLLGVFDSVSLADVVVDLAHGDTLVLFTDGVTEAKGAEGLFGDARLAAVLRSMAGRSADEVAAGVADAVARHGGGAPAADDMAVLAVKLDG
jgi:PAS domain S-box-containing protein